ncbi:hypothetical protein LCGC14_1279300 [marine sediment metagenome]|uniref:Transcription factor TFIIB cyclin-like domain-containing protein n=1 Tax=marine sediment metagenome TaxID=412755 RepID=A0A0F9KXH6_9ZZZZ
MECEECKGEFDGNVCIFCGLVVDSRPISYNDLGYTQRNMDITTLYSAGYRVWEHPLSPNIRKRSKQFVPRYQKKYHDYLYVKAYESISKLIGQLQLNKQIKFEALNLFKGIRDLDVDFFKHHKLAPTYLACIKIACKIHDYPISNHQLAMVIDYESDIDLKKNVSYMEKKFNKAYSGIIVLYKLILREPEYPKFIAYACSILGTTNQFMLDIYHAYKHLRKRFQPHFRIEGYILAIIYLAGMGKYTLKELEEKFHTSSITISNRKNEIKNYVKKM